MGAEDVGLCVQIGAPPHHVQAGASPALHPFSQRTGRGQAGIVEPLAQHESGVAEALAQPGHHPGRQRCWMLLDRRSLHDPQGHRPDASAHPRSIRRRLLVIEVTAVLVDVAQALTGLRGERTATRKVTDRSRHTAGLYAPDEPAHVTGHPRHPFAEDLVAHEVVTAALGHVPTGPEEQVGPHRAQLSPQRLTHRLGAVEVVDVAQPTKGRPLDAAEAEGVAALMNRRQHRRTVVVDQRVQLSAELPQRRRLPDGQHEATGLEICDEAAQCTIEAGLGEIEQQLLASAKLALPQGGLGAESVDAWACHVRLGLN